MKFGILLSLILHCSFLTAQILQRNRLTKQDKKEEIHAVYSHGEFEGSIKLTLYTNSKFTYEKHLTNYSIVSNGQWTQKTNLIILNSKIDSNNVSVRLHYFDTDTVRDYYEEAQNSLLNPPFYKTKFQVPINLKGSFLPDSRIFIDNDSSYCFPFFDTCVGEINSLNRIKIYFGNGFKTRWIKIDNKNFKRLLVIVQSDFIFNNYLSFRNHQLKLAGRKLTPIK